MYINLFENENIVELFERKISITEKIQLLKIIIKNERNIEIDFENTIYLCIGGMPACVNEILRVNNDILKYNKKIIKNIITGYMGDMRKYVKDATETVRIEHIYNSIPLQIGNRSSKYQYSKINTSARRKNYETAMQWLLLSNLVSRIFLLKTPKTLPEVFKDEENFKLYLSDVGILNSIPMLEDKLLEAIALYKEGISSKIIISGYHGRKEYDEVNLMKKYVTAYIGQRKFSR